MIPQNSDAYLHDMLNMSDESDLANVGDSEIAQFFSGCNVLLTGGSGFMGKLLIDKLLRCCPDIGTLFIIMRGKKGKTAEERFKEHFEDIVYERLNSERPYFLSKVVMIEGNSEDEDLGLSEESRKRLLCTHIIFHAAATVRFDEKIRVAANINVRGTKQLLIFAREMPNLKAFVHISTAYSHCIRKFLDEKHYEPPLDADNLLTLLEMFDDEKLDKISPIMLENWPNTYAYTKATAEHAVLKYSVGIPTCIVRPSIVVSTAKEPVAGWINNLYGPTGVVIGAGLGLMHTLHADPESIADIIPADYVISNIVAAAWCTGAKKNTPESITAPEENTDVSDDERVPIYNSVSSCQNPISWGEFMKLNEIFGTEVPSTRILWHYMFTLNKYLYMHYVFMFFLHLIPGAIVDALAVLTRREPILLKAYKKIHKFTYVISYFSTQQWEFRNGHVLKLWKMLNSTDREIFNFNVENLDWSDYCYSHIRGLRMYMVKDPMHTISEGRVRRIKLKIAHYTIVTIVCLLLLWGVVASTRFIW